MRRELLLQTSRWPKVINIGVLKCKTTSKMYYTNIKFTDFFLKLLVDILIKKKLESRNSLAAVSKRHICRHGNGNLDGGGVVFHCSGVF